MDNTRPLSSTDDPNDKSTGSDNLKTPETRQAESQGDTTQGTQPDANEELQSVITNKKRSDGVAKTYVSAVHKTAVHSTAVHTMTVHKTAIHKTKKVQDDNAQDDNAQNDDLQDHNVKNMSGLEIEHQDDNKADPPAHENPSSDSNSEAEHMSIVDTYDATYDTIVASITVLIDDVKKI
jgi:hypothetical protein